MLQFLDGLEKLKFTRVVLKQGVDWSKSEKRVSFIQVWGTYDRFEDTPSIQVDFANK
jgi:hypothetical protein